MSKTKQNSLTRFYSGKFGDDFILRNNDGTSVITKLPKISAVPRTEQQNNVVYNFRMAVSYAKTCMGDPAMKALYEARASKRNSAYRLAMADYLNAPQVSKIDTRGYSGHAGDKISLMVTDRIQAKTVVVTIVDPGGNLVEQGDCTVDSTGTLWSYVATTDVVTLSGTVITVTATDYPGNTGTGMVTLL